MSLLPNGRIDKVQFFQNRLEPWTENASEIGSSPAEIAEFADVVAAARAAYLAQQMAQQAARNATATFNQAVAQMSEKGSAIIQKVRAKAATDGNQIYSLASIPVPAQPSPVPAPGEPTALSVKLTGLGTLLLSWKCDNPANAVGTIYQIHRQLDYVGEFVLIGMTGTKLFEDRTLPAATASVVYQITATRSTARGPCARFPVDIGVRGKLHPYMVSTLKAKNLAA